MYILDVLYCTMTSHSHQSGNFLGTTRIRKEELYENRVLHIDFLLKSIKYIKSKLKIEMLYVLILS